jgi:integrase
MRKAHHVPLSRQAVDLLKDLQSITGPAGYVFPSIRTRTRPMSENTVNAGLRRLGYASDEMTGHRFRAVTSRCRLRAASGIPTPLSARRLMVTPTRCAGPITAARTGKSDWKCRNGGVTISTSYGKGPTSWPSPRGG